VSLSPPLAAQTSLFPAFTVHQTTGLTDVALEWTVLDLWTGAQKTYTNPPATAFQPVVDTGTFPCP